ncbi:small subunit ribosomal protein S16, partial [Tremellales sp. Uapishka_1]
MPVRIRLARHGQKHSPYYHLVAIPSTSRRDAKPIEKLGEYDPIPRVPADHVAGPSSNVFGETPAVRKEKRIEWDVGRIRWWLEKGAEPTKTVVKLLEKGGVLQTPHKWQHAFSPPPPHSTSPVLSSIPTKSATRADPVEGTVQQELEGLTGFDGKTAS